MYASVNSTSTTNSVVGSPAVDSSLEIPEWKRVLIMKKRATMHNTESTAGNVNNVNGVSDGGENGKCHNDYRETTPPLKKVTIGNINVELRSVNKFTSECLQQRSLSEVPKSNSASQEFDSHSSKLPDDLQYGPGIVDRLRAKFLNMGAKQEIKPVVRRFSSLENLPGSNSGPYRINTRGGGYSRQKSGFSHMNGGSGNVKKAQSMETLLSSSPSEFNPPSRRPNSRVFCGVKARIFSKNASTPPSDENDEPISRFFNKNTQYQRSVSASNIIENELPKPDTVKQVKRIFETPSLNDSEKTNNPPQRFRKVPTTLAVTPTSPCNGNIRSPFHQQEDRPLFEEDEQTDSSSPDAKKEIQINSAKEDEREQDDDDSTISADDYKIISVEISKPTDLSGDVVEDDVEIASHSSSSDHDEVNVSTPESTQDILEEEEIISLSPEVHRKQPVISPLSLPTASLELLSSPEDDISSDVPPTPPARVTSTEDAMMVEGPKNGWCSSQPQSVVFDFRNKDVKPNISLNPAPFGCRPVIKNRPSSPPRDSGFNGTGSDEEDWDETDVGADLPVISGITFCGENVKIGRGALIGMRNKKLSIQFDDQATSTFEYPSETTSPSPNEEVEPFDPDTAINSAANSRLSNYTPQVLTATNGDFELGVSQNRPPSSSPVSQTCKPTSPPESYETNDVLPASPEDSAGWSSTETVDILF